MGIGLRITITIVLTFLLIATGIELISEKEMVEVKCYDNHYNQIKGEVCLEKDFAYKNNKFYYSFFIGAGMLSIFIVPLILLSIEKLIEVFK